MSKLLRLLFMLGAIGSYSVLNAQNLTISGGSEHSVMICSKGKIFAWGNNKDATKGWQNLLGLKNSADALSSYVDEPKEVDVPDGITFSQVDAGSGAFNIALSCEGIVYMWGANESGQLGQGDKAFHPKPVPVLRGDAPANTVAGKENFLGNAVFVSASTNSSYAILSDGRVAAWGAHANNGSVGDPTINADATTPKIVQVDWDGDGVADGDLTGVTYIDAGDGQAYALVDNGLHGDDVAGDGLGVVYSWGGSDFNAPKVLLSRPLPNANSHKMAGPVLVWDEDAAAPGERLKDIKLLSAGDSHGIAVDAINGFVWSWGNDGWGCMTGTKPEFGRTENEGAYFANKVLSGEYGAEVTADDYLSNVKQVAGGRGFTVAVTTDGYSIAWGNNDGNGGALGSGIAGDNSCKTGPQLQRYDDNTIVTDAVSVSDGDNWGFMINEANDFYAWGVNAKGQLGIGSTQAKDQLTEITAAIPCDIQDPCPEVDMPPSYTICDGSSVSVSLGFLPPVGKEDKYSIVWEYSEDGNSYTDLGLTSFEPSLSDKGMYRVTVKYEGDNVSCGACPPITDNFEIIYYTAPFYDPIEDLDTNTYCGDKVTAHVNLIGAPGEYDWYGTLTSTNKLATSTGDATVSLNISDLEEDIADSIYYTWVEDVSVTTGLVGPATFPGSTGDNAIDKASTQIRAYKNVTIKSVDVMLDPGWGKRPTVTFTPTLYGSKTNGSGDKVPDLTKVMVTGDPYTLTFGDLAADGPAAMYTITTNLDVIGTTRGEEYWFRLVPNTTSDYTIKYSGGGSFPYSDNIDGATMQLIGNEKYDNRADSDFGQYVNFVLEQGSNYPCGRVRINVIKTCPPCTTPNNLDVKHGVDAVADGGTINVCEGTPINLSLDADWDQIPSFALPDVENMQAYIVSPLGVESPLGAEANGKTSTSLTRSHSFNAGQVIPALSGDWIIGVRNADCSLEQTIKIQVDAKPFPSITTSGTALEYCAVTNGGVELEGDDGLASITSDEEWFEWDGSAIDGAAVDPANLPGTKDYVLVATNGECSETSSPVTVTEKAVPTKPTLTNVTVCAEDQLDLNSASTVTPTSAISYTWTGPDSFTSSDQNPTVSTSADADKMAGTYTVTPTANLCPGPSADLEVTINDLPTATLSGGGEFCKEATPSLGIVLTGAKPYTISYNVNSGASQDIPATTDAASIPLLAEVAGDVVITKVVDANNCTTDYTTEQTETVTRTSDLVVTGVDASCVFADKEATVTFTLGGGKTDYSVSTATPEIPSFTSTHVYTATFDSKEATAYEYIVEDASGCVDNTGLVAAKGEINCACPVSATLSLESGEETDSICSSATTKLILTIEGSEDGASANYVVEIAAAGKTLTLADGTETSSSTDLVKTYEYTVSDVGEYSITSIEDDNCVGTGSGKMNVVNHPDVKPTITLSQVGDTTCTTGTAMFAVAYTFTGDSPLISTTGGASFNAAKDTLSLVNPIGTEVITVRLVSDYLCVDPTPIDSTITPAVESPETAVINPLSKATLGPDAGDATFAFTAVAPQNKWTGSWDKTKDITGVMVGTTTGVDNEIYTVSNIPTDEPSTTLDNEGEVCVDWIIVSPSGACPSDTDNVCIARYNKTTPVFNDTTICVGTSLDYTWPGVASLQDEESIVGWTVVGGTATGFTAKGSNVGFDIPNVQNGDTIKVQLEIEHDLLGNETGIYNIIVRNAVKAVITEPNTAERTITPNAIYDSYDVVAEADTATWSGSWVSDVATIPNILGTDGPSNATSVSYSLTGVSGKLPFDTLVTVSRIITDDMGVCPDDIATVTVIRRNITEATAEETTLCMDGAALTYTLVPISLPSSDLNESAVWIDERGATPDTLFGSPITSTTVTLDKRGEHKFTYRIYNENLRDTNGDWLESTDPITITVDTAVVQPTVAAIGEICTEEVVITGSELVNEETGLWTSDRAVTFKDSVDKTNADDVYNPEASNFVELDQTTVIWTVSSKYGVCLPKSASNTVTMLAPLTEATISGGKSTYCKGEPVDFSTLATSSFNLESGKWTVGKSPSTVTLSAVDEKDNTLDFTSYVNTVGIGDYELTWTVSSSKCTSSSESKSVAFTVNDVPDVSSLSFNSYSKSICEGESQLYSVSGVTGTYSWSGTGVFADVYKQGATGSSITVQAGISSVNTEGETLDNGTNKIFVDVSNACGTNTAINSTDNIEIKLAPRSSGTIPVTGSAVSGICTSDLDGTFGFDIPQLNGATDYTFSALGLLENDITAKSDFTLEEDDYVKEVPTGSYDVVVTFKNECTEDALSVKTGAKYTSPTSSTQSVVVEKAEETDAYLSITGERVGDDNFTKTDELSFDYCLGDKEQVIHANLKGNPNMGIGVRYLWELTGQDDKFETTEPFVSMRLNLLNDGDIISVKIIPGTNACVDKENSSFEAEVTMNDFTVQESLVEGGEFCDEDVTYPITLTADAGTTATKEDFGIRAVWYRNGEEIFKTDSLLSHEIIRQDKEGLYTVELFNDVCPSKMSTGGDVIIRKKPETKFNTNDTYAKEEPFLKILAENPKVPVPIYRMPMTVENLEEGEYITTWSAFPEGNLDPRVYEQEWLEDQNVLNTKIRAINEETVVTYVVLVENKYLPSCATEDTVIVKPSLPFNAPTAFTPNGDNLNDYWVIDGTSNKPNCTVKIYNRWGNIVYEKFGGYNANFDGADLPEGTYYWTIEFNEDDEEPESGTITILR